MGEFYKNLWDMNLPKLEALRQAQLTTLKSYKPRAKGGRGVVIKKGTQRVEELPARASPHQRSRTRCRRATGPVSFFRGTGDKCTSQACSRLCAHEERTQGMYGDAAQTITNLDQVV